MNHIFYLKNCNTCTKVLKSLHLPSFFTLQDIKETPITVNQLEALYSLSNSYEALFSRRAKLYTKMGIKDLALSDVDYKHYILKHYTFLKRPIIVFNNSIFIGSSPKSIEALKKAIADEN